MQSAGKKYTKSPLPSDYLWQLLMISVVISDLYATQR